MISGVIYTCGVWASLQRMHLKTSPCSELITETFRCTKRCFKWMDRCVFWRWCDYFTGQAQEELSLSASRSLSEEVTVKHITGKTLSVENASVADAGTKALLALSRIKSSSTPAKFSWRRGGVMEQQLCWCNFSFSSLTECLLIIDTKQKHQVALPARPHPPFFFSPQQLPNVIVNFWNLIVDLKIALWI